MVIRCKGLQRWRFPSSYLASISCWALTLHIMPGSHSVRVFIHPPVSKSNISSPKTIGNQCLCQQISPTQKWVKEKLPWCHKCMSSGFQDRLWQCEQNNKILSEPREEAEWLCSHWGDTALPMWFLQTAATVAAWLPLRPPFKNLFNPSTSFNQILWASRLLMQKFLQVLCGQWEGMQKYWPFAKEMLSMW